MNNSPHRFTAARLAELGPESIPGPLTTTEQLIYNSPAALDFNSPGAQGFGVKRAGLSIPGSVMLLVSPGCCGRNTAAVRGTENFGHRFAYYLLDENDIVTGRHLAKIPAAVKAFIDSRPTPPTAVMLCITCVDALLGTDMVRVAKKAAAAVSLPVLPCYMYALTRESRKPPMIAIRQTVYSLLKPRPKNPRAANILGFFAPIGENSELYAILRSFGIKTIRQIGACQDFDEYQSMAEANFNLLLNPEGREAADWFRNELNIPSIELTGLFQPEKIHRQYELLALHLRQKIDDTPYREKAQAMIDAFCDKYRDEKIAVGSRINGNPFELALALSRFGLTVTEIYATPTAADYPYIRLLAAIAPTTAVLSNLSPSMVNYRQDPAAVTLAIGDDAMYYHPAAAGVSFRDENPPFGYQAVTELFRRMIDAMKTTRLPHERS